MLKVASALLAATSASEMHQSGAGLDDKETKLSQSFASAFAMQAPKVMSTPTKNGNLISCADAGGEDLTWAATGKAFLDGCYKNTTRSTKRNEATGEEAQHYLYMWRHACAFTKWVPSNQFMYANLDYND